MRTKADAVQEYLRGQNVAAPDQALTSAVVLTNRRLTLGPQLLKQSGVVRLVALEEMLKPWVNPNGSGFWAGLARTLGLARTVPPVFADFAAVTRALDRLPTWDMIGLYGGKDDGIPLESVEQMKSALAKGSAAARRSQFHVYPDAPHAFHADYRPTFRAAEAQDGWKRCIAWFRQHGVA